MTNPPAPLDLDAIRARWKDITDFLVAPSVVSQHATEDISSLLEHTARLEAVVRAAERALARNEYVFGRPNEKPEFRRLRDALAALNQEDAST